jgi:hypothetical protein
MRVAGLSPRPYFDVLMMFAAGLSPPCLPAGSPTG